MKKIVLVLLTVCLAACGSKQDDLVVKTTIKGLKKGTVYLKRVIDTSLVIVDSVIVNGNATFELKSPLGEPDVFHLYLDKNSTDEERISFFADKGITEINTTLKNFVFDVKIKGCEQQKTFEQYKKTISKINNRSLDLIKETFEAQKNNDTAKYNSLKKESENVTKRKYLYTVNFALNNRDSEVAPYLALSEIYNARIDLLDTINKSLTPKIKASKYGKELQGYLDKRTQ